MFFVENKNLTFSCHLPQHLSIKLLHLWILLLWNVLFFIAIRVADMFHKKLSGGFCLRVRAGLPTVSEIVLNILLPFCAMYLC